MSVPKASVDKNHFALPTEDQIWLPCKPLAVEPISISHGMDEFPNGEFGICILRMNGGHDGRPFRTVDVICHAFTSPRPL